MIQDHQKLLAVHEVRIRDLMAFCDKLKLEIDEKKSLLNQKEDELQQANRVIDELNAKCDNLLTAQAVSYADGGDIKGARMRLSKLVREVDKCIALLNE